MRATAIILFLMLLPASAFAHGHPTIEEFQMFPGTFTQAIIANPAGGIVAVPFAVVGAVGGLIASPFYGPTGDIGENVMAGVVFIGMCGYMVGQQIGWPFYGIEKGIGWCFK